jgi:hypothetical protein
MSQYQFALNRWRSQPIQSGNRNNKGGAERAPVYLKSDVICSAIGLLSEVAAQMSA